MSSRKLLDAFDGIDASMILEAEPKGKEEVIVRRIKKLRKPLLLVAAALLIVTALTVSVIAGTVHSNMEPYWNRVFAKPAQRDETNLVGGVKEAVTEPLDEEIADRLEGISEMPEEISLTGDNDDVAFRVIGVTGAGGAAYVWLEMVLSDALVAEYGDQVETIGPGRTENLLNGEKGGGSSSFLYLGTKASLLGSFRLTQAQGYATEWKSSADENKSSQETLLSRPDNTYCFAYRFQRTNTSVLSGKKLTLRFTDVTARLLSGSGESVTIAQGVWELTMKLNFSESVLIYHPKVMGQRYICDTSDPSRVMISGRDDAGALTTFELAYSTVQISPIYMQIDMGCRVTSVSRVAKPNYATVVMADGSRFEVRTSGAGGSSSSVSDVSDLMIKIYFDEPIDHKQVVAVIYAGVTFSLTEEVMQK